MGSFIEVMGMGDSKGERKRERQNDGERERGGGRRD